MNLNVYKIREVTYVYERPIRSRILVATSIHSSGGGDSIDPFEKFNKKGPDTSPGSMNLPASSSHSSEASSVKIAPESMEALATEAKDIADRLSATQPTDQVCKVLEKHKASQSTDAYAVPAIYVDNLDSNMIKGGKVGFAVRNMDDKETIVVNFQLTSEGIKKLEGALERNTDEFDVIKSDTFQYFSSEGGKIDTEEGACIEFTCQTVICNFPDIGAVIVVNDNEQKHHALNGEVTVILDPTVQPKEAHNVITKILNSLEIQGVTSESKPEDQVRIKMLSMFQILYPSQVSALMDKGALTLPLDNLKKEMINLVPELQQKFDDTLEKMYEQEVRPGQRQWALKGIADEMRTCGAMGLMAGVPSIANVVKVLKGGALSSYDRISNGIVIRGVSLEKDFQSGGARSVFTRVVTREMQECELSSSFPWADRGIAILYDLDVAEGVCSMYVKDNFGTREPSIYDKRKNIPETTKDLAAYNTANELMVEEGPIPPKMIRAVVVKDEEQKAKLLAELRAQGLLDKDDNIMGKHVDDFVRISTTLKEEFWNRT